jgi:hypothetical protein
MADNIISQGTHSHSTTQNPRAHLHHFTHNVDQNVTVSMVVPTTNTKGTAGAVPVIKDFPATQDVGDAPGRKIVNFYFADSQGKAVNDFDPPVELRVKITADDLNRKKGQKFRLVFWHNQNQHWREIEDHWTVMHPKGKFFEDPSVSPGGGNDIVVQLSHWPDDPAVGSAP